jgi:hypothetical protein
MSACNWQSKDLYTFSNLVGPLVVAVDARDAGGVGGLLGNVNVEDGAAGGNYPTR